jgi:single-strand DNA-binding protein
MSNETFVTVIGNLTADPEIRFTPSGAAVANFTIASTPRKFNKQTNEWDDGDTLFMRCTAWQEMAENVVESLIKGTRVVAYGRLEQRSYEDREGNQRTVVEMRVEEVGPSLRWATAQPRRAREGQRTRDTVQRQQGTPAGDPWSNAGQAFADEPPF